MGRIVGVILLATGLAGLAFGGFRYTRNRKVIDAGPIHVTAREKESVRVPPLVAGGVAVVGAILLVARPRGK